MKRLPGHGAVTCTTDGIYRRLTRKNGALSHAAFNRYIKTRLVFHLFRGEIQYADAVFVHTSKNRSEIRRGVCVLRSRMTHVIRCDRIKGCFKNKHRPPDRLYVSNCVRRHFVFIFLLRRLLYETLCEILVITSAGIIINSMYY